VLGPLQPLQKQSGCDFDFRFDGGTGAAPLTSLQHTGIPWELGLPKHSKL
jgi:hypothetical protein